MEKRKRVGIIKGGGGGGGGGGDEAGHSQLILISVVEST